MDVAKTRLQLDKTGRYNGMSDCLSKMYRLEGWRSLYKGLVPFQAHLMTKYAMRFAIFGFFQDLLGAGKNTKSKSDSLRTFGVSGRGRAGVGGQVEAVLAR